MFPQRHRKFQPDKVYGFYIDTKPGRKARGKKDLRRRGAAHPHVFHNGV